jgi:HD domain-containing protein
MELRSVEELMDLLYACRGSWDAPGLRSRRVDLHQHALQTAALLRRRRPADKELQVAGLVHAIGPLLRPGDEAAHPECAAEAVRGLLGERVSRLVREHHRPDRPALPLDDDLLRLRQADEEGRSAGFDAGSWRTGARCWSSWPRATPVSGLLTDGPS